MKFLLLLFCSTTLVVLTVFAAAKKEEDEPNTFQGQKLSWKEDDGLEIKIIRPISEEKCKIRSQVGDTVEQFYELFDAEKNVIGTNFGKKPYIFQLGNGDVIAGMDRATTGMCIGEKRKVVIPGKLGFGDAGRDHDNIKTDQTLYYTIQLVNIFRPVPGPSWKEDDGLEIEVIHQIDAEVCKKSAPGDIIYQQYTLHLADGTLVDSSASRGEPFKFKLGAKQVINGIDRAMTAMCEGEKRKVIIPPNLGYGSKGQPPQIPGNATLHFEITLEKLVKKDEL